jgi:hypothetical protein
VSCLSTAASRSTAACVGCDGRMHGWACWGGSHSPPRACAILWSAACHLLYVRCCMHQGCCRVQATY